MRVFVNGETKEFGGELKLHDLLKHLDIPSERIAVELNKLVVRRQDWAETDVRENDTIEIVQFVGGG
ncbi:MAG: sulfur carrier protein ThiS [Pyrinomonadaceae bacterium]